MRAITRHLADPADAATSLDVIAVNDNGPGADFPSMYRIGVGTRCLDIKFKSSAGLGVTMEALLAVVIDRLECFQTYQMGHFKCIENEEALGHLTKALAALHDRTLKRRQRGVEGTGAP